jgi:hypothetical protein
MNELTRRLIQAIHDSPPRIMFAAAGAGSRALTDLLAVPGASRTLLEALVPYAADSFDEFLGQQSDQYVSDSTARLMAGRALARAYHLRELETWPIAGLACTATIVTDRPKKGEHRAHVAAWTPQRLRSYTLRLEKDARDRAGEEGIVSALILNTLAEACGLTDRLAFHLGAGDSLADETYDIAAAANELYEDRTPYFGIQADGYIRGTDARPAVVLSGSFNPLHGGHTGLAEVAAILLGKPVAFEISAVNVDKPRLPVNTLLERLGQFAGRYPVFASNAPTFVEKARLYPGVTFVVGFDTATRIIAPRYYGDSETAMLAALAEMRDGGTRFLVAGREGSDGVFRELHELAIPEGFDGLFQAIPGRLFRHDVSSTAIRRAFQEEDSGRI